jgi:hypothetical protein
LHGVHALLYSQAAPRHWPAEVTTRLRDRAIQRAIWELSHQQVLKRTLAVLYESGVEPVLIKGTALAYSIYADPALRVRGDTDLIISRGAQEQVHEVLVSLGFVRSVEVSGKLVSYQGSYTLCAADGSPHRLDLHWRINNSEVLSQLFTYEELHNRAEPLPQLCNHALGASRVHALLLACMHRLTHIHNPYYVGGTAHHEPDRLIWLYDIHLLAGALTRREWAEFSQMAIAKGLCAVCSDGMQRAHACFGTALPVEVMAALAAPDSVEPAARYLGGGRLSQKWMDFRALGSLRRQLLWLKESLFPPVAYMREKYVHAQLNWLPWLYLRRAALGLAKILLAGERGN